ncbi:hypothetical protein CHH26_02825 [Qipengyuania flava]|uniref:hypothetical protein n=2 Tax=Qipengyuania flava TaxID=192812 RepID=UPI000B8C5083|nr:hypothetical protein [Qipengyuania flava]ASP29296.1 hypothetical protein CHH26_02825 [Qipengyuania flava]
MKKDDNKTAEANLFEDEEVAFDTESDNVASSSAEAKAQGDGREEEKKVSGRSAINTDEPAEALSRAEELAERDEFSRPAIVPGEVNIQLNKLEEWRYHPCYKSRSKDVGMAGLLASAADPQQLPPIEVLQEIDGRYRVKDGRWRLLALREQHGSDSSVEARCVIFGGTEGEAVEEVCDQALGSTPRTQIETAQAVLNVQRIAGITQKGIAERFPALKKDQVSRMTIAAKTVEQFPSVFNLLEEPDRVSIDLCVKFAQFMKAASDEERATVVEEAEAHADAGASFKRNELFGALGIEVEGGSEAPAKPDPLAPIASTDIFGADDQPVGAIEMLADEVMRIRLPDPAAMTRDEREAAAAAFILQIRIHFELDAQG